MLRVVYTKSLQRYNIFFIYASARAIILGKSAI